jgi:hypothetical protein
MKNSLFAFLLFITYSGISQNVVLERAKLPVQVKATFESEYPAAKANTWSLTKKIQYTTSFQQPNGKECTIWIDDRGILVRVQEEIEKNEVPKIVQDALDKRMKTSLKAGKYSRTTVTKATIFKVTKKITYLQNISNDRHSWSWKFNEKGKYLGKEKDRTKI